MSYAKELATAIDYWINEKRNRSLSMLARISGVSYSSARRAAQAEVESSQQTCLKLAGVVMTKNKYVEFTDRYWPVLGEHVAKCGYPPNKNEAIQKFAESEKHFILMVLASSSEGTTLEEVTHFFGAGYEQYFEDLVDSGCLARTENNRWNLRENFGTSSFQLARKMMVSLINSHNRACDEIQSSTTSWVAWESVKPEVAHDINAEIKKCTKTIWEKVSDPQNRGNVLICTGIYSGVLKGMENL